MIHRIIPGLFFGCCAVLLGAVSVFAQAGDSCKIIFNKAYQYGRGQQYQMEYDTARKYIENCANSFGSDEGFSLSDEGIQGSNLSDTSRYRKYRYWLISVLFLNKVDPYYFCHAMYSIMQTYAYSEQVRFPNAGISICRWMISHNMCPMYPWHSIDSATLASRYYYWSQGDTSIHLDSTINTMHELGLDFLDSLNLNAKVKIPSHIYIGAFSVVPNPSQGIVIAKYTLALQGFVQFSVYDALGKQIWYKAGESEEEGSHQLPIDLRSSPSGTYYARIEAGFGDVRTVKLVHEK
jgi:hypothetical protein